jgi:DNA-binding NarL/FixJ family response regulator
MRIATFLRSMASVCIIDDEEMIVSLLRDQLQAQGHVIAGTAACVRDAMKLPASDVTLLDLKLGDNSGLAVFEAREARKTRWVIMSGELRPALIGEVLHLGAKGIVCKRSDPKGAALAADVVSSGQEYYSPAIMPLVISQLRFMYRMAAERVISDQEERVLIGLWRRKPQKEIAHYLRKDASTVYRLTANLKQKLRLLQTADDQDVVEAAKEQGLLQLALSRER